MTSFDSRSVRARSADRPARGSSRHAVPAALPDAVRALLAEAGIDPALAGEPDGDLGCAIRLTQALGERLDLDLKEQAALLHYLHRIDLIGQHLRAQHGGAPAPGPAAPRDRPAPWHEPHGSTGD